MPSRRQILIAPLDWGLGHAARCIPLIRRETVAGNEVVIAAKGPIASFITERFPELEIIPLDGYEVKYHSYLPVWLSVLLQAPSIHRKIKAENRWLESLIKRRHFDEVISDNRYGLWNKSIRSVIITHQLRLRLPRFFRLISKQIDTRIRRLLTPFDECWIPDEEGHDSLSGELSYVENKPANLHYIGRLSRFDGFSTKHGISTPEHFDQVILLSGPEPRRTALEKKLVREVKSTTTRTLIIQGIPETSERREDGCISFWPTASDEEIAFHLKSAKKIICRSGYSTLMDLISLGVKAELIPTPGQTEQEYLALRMKSRFGWTIRNEKDIR